MSKVDFGYELSSGETRALVTVSEYEDEDDPYCVSQFWLSAADIDRFTRLLAGAHDDLLGQEATK